ncbi:MAG TPA: type II secretion system protein GspG [Thermoanaerobaculaceae bacterium]|nr:type II secretion system protein GspG [Thermoanaerobaculaceae bacterium]HPS77546.1 type II secretion system protein GspG [Thermoanaerobaculaceae bacterium]
MLNAINRGKQKRTMGDMRSIATAVEAYSVDNNFYPKLGPGAIRPVLLHYIEPTYIKVIPASDGWRMNLHWMGGTAGDTYTIWSGAKGHVQTESTVTLTTELGARTEFMDDIIYSVGAFVQYPEGMQAGA